MINMVEEMNPNADLPRINGFLQAPQDQDQIEIPPMLRLRLVHRIDHTIVRRKVMNAILYTIKAETGTIPNPSLFFPITRFVQMEDRPLTGMEMMKVFLDISLNQVTSVMEDWMFPMATYQLTSLNGIIFCPFCPEFYRLYRSFRLHLKSHLLLDLKTCLCGQVEPNVMQLSRHRSVCPSSIQGLPMESSWLNLFLLLNQ